MKPNQKSEVRVQNTQPRFVVKWNNGTWKLFDRHRWDDETTFVLKRDADEAAKQANMMHPVKH